MSYSISTDKIIPRNSAQTVIYRGNFITPVTSVPCVSSEFTCELKTKTVVVGTSKQVTLIIPEITFNGDSTTVFSNGALNIVFPANYQMWAVPISASNGTVYIGNIGLRHDGFLYIYYYIEDDIAKPFEQGVTYTIPETVVNYFS
jgi:hypothetical protein